MTLDYLITATPIILSTCIPDYNIYTYSVILFFVLVLIMISHFDKKGRIIINYFKEANPRKSFVEFENQKLIDLIKN